MILFVIGLVAISLLLIYQQAQPQKPDSGSLFAPGMNEIYQHATILVRIFGDKFDFNNPKYQQVNYWMNFEAPYDDIIHIHSDRGTTGFLFETLNFKIDEQCFVFPDSRDFCTNEKYSLKYFVNDIQVSSINDYDVIDGDRILISYGPETKEELDLQLEELNSHQLNMDVEHLLRK